MIKFAYGFATLVALAASSLAGTETSFYTTTEYKGVEQPGPFSDAEIHLDLFGAYQDGKAPDHAGPIKDHAWGGGAAVSYFFTKYFGLSLEGSWLDGHANASRLARRNYDSPETQSQNVDGNLVFRYPIDRWTIAPYIFLGGGAALGSGSWAVGDVGTGIEYRIIPNKFGVFTDGRWNYYGDRYGHDTQNNFMVRVGTRLVF